jgi:hypothetical protein
MVIRPRPLVGGLMVAALLVVGACSSGTATPAPTSAPAASSAAGGGGAGEPTSAPGGGQATTAPAGGGSVDANTVLTADVATSIIGGPVTQIPIPSTSGMSLVSYTNTSGGAVTVLVEPVPAGAAAAMMQTAIGVAGSKGELTTFGGLGDAAGKVVNANDAAVVFTKGSNLVVIHAQSISSSGTDLDTKIESVAQQIAGKL